MIKVFLLLSVFLITSCSSNHRLIQKLSVIDIYDVITDGEFEPSGLTLWDGELFTVSDKHNYIYRIVLGQNKAILEPFIHISNDGQGKYDFEGITHDDEYFYVVSERYFQVLKVSKDGSEKYVMSTDNEIENAGKKAGLFQVNNAYLEGICMLDTKTLLLTAERQPRGILKAKIDGNGLHIDSVYPFDYSNYPSKEDRNFDFSGLSCDNDIFVIERNTDMVTQLKYDNGHMKQHRAWSFEHIIYQPKNQYQDMEYGHAEGLVVSGDEVFVILDNNKSPHKDGRSNNSLLLRMRK